jgi:hypothetical protein
MEREGQQLRPQPGRQFLYARDLKPKHDRHRGVRSAVIPDKRGAHG